MNSFCNGCDIVDRAQDVGSMCTRDQYGLFCEQILEIRCLELGIRACFR